MPIEFRCANCGRLVSAPDSTAGKTGKCPHCAAYNAIPADGKSDDDTSGEQATSVWPDSTPLAPRVPMQAPLGGAPAYYGESSPGLSNETPRQPDALMGPTGGYSSGPMLPPGGGAYVRPHRGSMIVAFGTISLVFGIMTAFGCLCCLLYPLSAVSVVAAVGCALPAIILGVNDLRAIDAGEMDHEGRSQTKTGLVLGIAGLAVVVLGMVLPVLIAILTNLAQGFSRR